MPMTNVEFAIHASRMARRASEWAADSIDLKDYRDKPMRQEVADRFIKSQRDVLDFIEAVTRESTEVPNGER